MRGSWLIVWALACWASAGTAGAHTRSESHSVWEVNGADVDLAITCEAVAR